MVKVPQKKGAPKPAPKSKVQPRPSPARPAPKPAPRPAAKGKPPTPIPRGEKVVQALADLIYRDAFDPAGFLAHRAWVSRMVESGVIPPPKKGRDPLRGLLKPEDLTPTVVHAAEKRLLERRRAQCQSENRRYLETGRGVPYFIAGDTECDPALNKEMALEFLNSPAVPEAVKNRIRPLLPYEAPPPPPPVEVVSLFGEVVAAPPARREPKARPQPEGGVSFKGMIRGFLKKDYPGVREDRAAGQALDELKHEEYAKRLQKDYGRTPQQARAALINIKNNR